MRRYGIIALLLIVAIALAYVIYVNTPRQPRMQPSVVGLLMLNRTDELHEFLNEMQKGFEDGRVSETQLRDTFWRFNDLDKVSAQRLSKWVKTNHESYPALLGEGIYLIGKGVAVRGEKSVGETSLDTIGDMERYFEQA